jgi:hypothetical protein
MAEQNESRYMKSIKAWQVALEDALAIANDPFKAPEQNVEASKHVLDAAWNMQVEYAAMMRKDDQ